MSSVPHNMWVQFGQQTIQTKDYLVMNWEFMHSRRIIPLDNRPHQITSPAVHLFQGESVGHWDSDTLVVDTTNQNDKTWFDLAGNFKTPNLKVDEKFTPMDANTIVYEATMTDSTIYTKPWTARWNITRDRTAANSDGHPHELLEYACIEGNQDPQHYTEDQGGKQKQVLGKK